MFISVLTILLGFAFVALCIFLIFIVLLQPGKGGGLGGLGAGSASSAISESLGATQAEKSLSRWTSWGLFLFFLLCLVLTFLSNYRTGGPILQLDEGAAPPADAQIIDGQPAPDMEGAAQPDLSEDAIEMRVEDPVLTDPEDANNPADLPVE
jgi:preprotein translocase subunit SecG